MTFFASKTLSFRKKRIKRNGRWEWLVTIPEGSTLLKGPHANGKFKQLGPSYLATTRSNKTARNRARKKRAKYKKLSQKRKSGVMTDYLREYVGAMSRTTTYKAPPGYSVTENFRPIALTVSLSGVVSNRGNFKRPNNQNFVHTREIAMTGNRVLDQPGVIQVGEGVLSNFQEVSGTPAVLFPDPSVYNTALGRLYEKLRGNVDISIDLAEVHKTKGMMTQTVHGMRNLALTFVKMRRSNPRDWGNLWLEYTNGWKPLASSIYEAGHRLLVENTGPRYMKINANCVTRDAKNYRDSFPVFPNIPRSTGVHVISRCKFEISYNIAASRLEELAGFTSLNPVSIAWELTPYSFVVDWFYDLGGYLRNYENALLYRSDFVDGYVVETQYQLRNSTVNGLDYYAPGQQTTTYSMAGSKLITKKKRSVLTGSPLPRAPRFDAKLGASRLTSGISLLGQMLSSLKHPTVKTSDSFNAASEGFQRWLGTNPAGRPPRK